MVSRSASALALTSALVLAGCPGGPSAGSCVRNSDCVAGSYCSGGSCTYDCTAATVADDCAAGEMCSSFGMCVGAPDAGPRDSGPPPVDGGADAFDVRPACVIAGGTDGDADGFCVADPTAPDCDDDDATLHPGATEVCTAHDAALDRRALDEDCDDAIDEDCGWYFGTPHPMSWTQTSPEVTNHGLSEDGTRFYFWSGIGFGVSTRASLADEFGPPTPLPFGGSAPEAVAPSLAADELETITGCWTAGEYDICRATRTSIAEPFGPPVRLEELSMVGVLDIHPSLSHDGLELFFSSNRGDGVRRIYRTTRSGPGMPFSPPELVGGLDPGGLGADAPFITRDRRTLFYELYGTGETRLEIATRSDPSVATFATPMDAAGLNTSTASNFYMIVNERTAEIFWNSGREWSPGSRSIWRARICRDGPCPTIAIDCPPPSVPSADGLHCYEPVSTAANWGSARATCAARGGGHLVSVHSAAENAVVLPLVSVPAWLGSTDVIAEGVYLWDSEEPFSFDSWFVSKPNDTAHAENCAAMNTGGEWSDTDCARSYPYVCEREMWPTW
jgi:hypothetical protein